MPDLEIVRKSLQDRLRELTARAEYIDDDLGEQGDDDSQEQASESSADEVLEGIGRLAVQEIAQIKAALARIDAGTYGVCVRCEQPIADKRLQAVPHATSCVKCA